MSADSNAAACHDAVRLAKRRVRAAASTRRSPVARRPRTTPRLIADLIASNPGASLAIVFALSAATSPLAVLRCIGFGARAVSVAKLLSTLRA